MIKCEQCLNVFLIYTVNKSNRSRRIRENKNRTEKKWEIHHQNQFINMNVIKLKIEFSYWILHSISCISAVIAATAVVVILFLLFSIRDASHTRARALDQLDDRCNDPNSRLLCIYKTSFQFKIYRKEKGPHPMPDYGIVVVSHLICHAQSDLVWFNFIISMISFPFSFFFLVSQFSLLFLFSFSFACSE